MWQNTFKTDQPTTASYGRLAVTGDWQRLASAATLRFALPHSHSSQFCQPTSPCTTHAAHTYRAAAQCAPCRPTNMTMFVLPLRNSVFFGSPPSSMDTSSSNTAWGGGGGGRPVYYTNLRPPDTRGNGVCRVGV
jgi:hypothetical protein